MDEPKVMEKREPIRGWYERTTKKSRIGFIVMTVVALSVMVSMWVFASMPTLQKTQTFNGALTVPLIGGLWIFAFIFMFLVPSREASFRAQEALEEGIDMMKQMIEENVAPAAKVWERLGLQVEKEYPEIRKKIEESIADLKKTAVRAEKAFEDNAVFVTEAKPVLEALKRIEDRIENGLLDDFESMTEAVKRMSGIPPASMPKQDRKSEEDAVVPMPVSVPLSILPEGREPDLNVALSSIKKRKQAVAPAQPK